MPQPSNVRLEAVRESLFKNARNFFGHNGDQRAKINERWDTNTTDLSQPVETQVRHRLQIYHCRAWLVFLDTVMTSKGEVGCGPWSIDEVDGPTVVDGDDVFPPNCRPGEGVPAGGYVLLEAPPVGSSDTVQPQYRNNLGSVQDALKQANEKIIVQAEALAKAKALMLKADEIVQGRRGPVTIHLYDAPGQEAPRVVARAHMKLPALIARMRAGIHTYLVGPAGSGKTTAAEQAGKALGLQFSFMSVGPQTTKTDILGYMNATGNYVQTEFRKRFEHGGIFLFDEMDAGNPGVLTCVNAALANNACAFPDGMVERHEDFRCIAAGNTFGTGPDRQYVGRQEMDAASIDRFNFLEWPYDEGLELALAEALDKPRGADWCKYIQLVRVAVLELGLRHVVSPRATINGLKLLMGGVDREEVETTQLWKSLKPDEIKRIKAKMRVDEVQAVVVAGPTGRMVTANINEIMERVVLSGGDIYAPVDERGVRRRKRRYT